MNNVPKDKDEVYGTVREMNKGSVAAVSWPARLSPNKTPGIKNSLNRTLKPNSSGDVKVANMSNSSLKVALPSNAFTNDKSGEIKQMPSIR
jgi:hypothetical protein